MSFRWPNLVNFRRDSPGVSVRSCAVTTHTPYSIDDKIWRGTSPIGDDA
jgi:hypothetical protein